MTFGDWFNGFIGILLAGLVLALGVIARREMSRTRAGCAVGLAVFVAFGLAVAGYVALRLAAAQASPYSNMGERGMERAAWFVALLSNVFGLGFALALPAAVLVLGLWVLVTLARQGPGTPSLGCAVYALPAVVGWVAMLSWFMAGTLAGIYRLPPPEVVMVMRAGGVLGLIGAVLFMVFAHQVARGRNAVLLGGLGLALMVAGPNINLLGPLALPFGAAPLLVAVWLARRSPAAV